MNEPVFKTGMSAGWFAAIVTALVAASGAALLMIAAHLLPPQPTCRAGLVEAAFTLCKVIR